MKLWGEKKMIYLTEEDTKKIVEGINTVPLGERTNLKIQLEIARQLQNIGVQLEKISNQKI